MDLNSNSVPEDSQSKIDYETEPLSKEEMVLESKSRKSNIEIQNPWGRIITLKYINERDLTRKLVLGYESIVFIPEIDFEVKLKKFIFK